MPVTALQPRYLASSFLEFRASGGFREWVIKLVGGSRQWHIWTPPRTHGRLTGRPCGRAGRPFVTMRLDLVAEQPVAALFLV